MISNAIILTMIAGLMNGSYAFPIKYFKSWKDENIWLVFSPIAFLLMPWLCLPSINSDIVGLIFSMPISILSVLIISGISFGVGMIVFTFSLRYVGLGISFVLNISSSTVLATLLPIILMEPKKIFTWFGLAEILALIFFCVAVLASYYASRYKSKNQNLLDFENNSKVSRGILLGVISGVLTSAQGFAYAYSTTLLKTGASNYSEFSIMSAPWIPIFSAAFLPCFAYFLCKGFRSDSLKNFFSFNTAIYLPLCLIMGVLYFGSLLVFSMATISLGKMGAVIAWPMLMIFIILTSNAWSFAHQEWKNSSRNAFVYLFISLLSFVLAIVSLSFAGYLNT